MINSAALHLASLADVGTPVTVVGALPKKQGGDRTGKGAGERDWETVGSPDGSRSAR
jgi:hypothetical protein